MLHVLLALACTQVGTETDTEHTVETDPPEQVSYRARAVIGALDRIHVVRETADLCVALGLVSPADTGPFALDVPDPWAVEFAWADRHLDAEPCWTEAPVEPAWCFDGEGSIAFGEVGEIGYPATLDLDATLRWGEDRPGWLAPEVALETADLPVTQE